MRQGLSGHAVELLQGWQVGGRSVASVLCSVVHQLIHVPCSDAGGLLGSCSLLCVKAVELMAASNAASTDTLIQLKVEVHRGYMRGGPGQIDYMPRV